MEKETEKPAEIEYPTGMKLAIITLALCLSVFLVALDNTIIGKYFFTGLLEWSLMVISNCYTKNNGSVQGLG